MVADERGLVRLLQRADWTRLSMEAEASDGSRVLIAPGMRYWYQTADDLTGCDGGRPWELSPEDTDPAVHWVSQPQAPLAELLCPAWLLVDSVLRARGETRVCGREALDVVVTRRPSLRGGPAAGEDMTWSADALVDADLGILLRLAMPGDSGEPDVIELLRADFAPVIDPARFRPPPGSRVAEGAGQALGAMLGPGWQAAATAAGLAAGALGAWVRYSPFRQGQRAAGDGGDIDAAIPRDEPAPGPSSGGGLAAAALSDELLGLLHRGGPAALAATVHQWTDTAALAASVPESARRTGLGGLGLLMDAISERAVVARQVSAIRFAEPGVYQIDYTRPPVQRRRPVTIACDGQQRWSVYSDKVTAGPAGPPPGDIGDLTDPSWLLRSELSGGAAVTVGNRAGYRITATGRPGDRTGPMVFPASVAVVDAEFGVILRLTCYRGGRAVLRYELRDISTDVGADRPRMPAGLPVIERPFRQA